MPEFRRDQEVYEAKFGIEPRERSRNLRVSTMSNPIIRVEASAMRWLLGWFSRWFLVSWLQKTLPRANKKVWYNRYGGLVAIFYFPINIGNVIIPIDEVIFFRGVGIQPPTRIIGSPMSPVYGQKSHTTSWPAMAVCSCHTHRIHGAGIFTYIYLKNHPNVGKYAIHGASGIGNQMYQDPFLWRGRFPDAADLWNVEGDELPDSRLWHQKPKTNSTGRESAEPADLAWKNR